MLLLLPSWGETAAMSEALVAECCSRGRPPFMAILADGAPDGSDRQARHCEKTTRHATAALGLPKERLLFVGVRQGHLPMPGHPLFPPLIAAMAQVSWRQDCNLIAACSVDAQHSDMAAAWQLACAVGEGVGLPTIALGSGARPAGTKRLLW